MNRSYHNIGLTQREKAIWPPKKGIDLLWTIELVFWLGLITMLVAVFVEPNIPAIAAWLAPHREAQEYTFYDEPDAVQEAGYCIGHQEGEEIVGGTASAWAAHCKRFI